MSFWFDLFSRYHIYYSWLFLLLSLLSIDESIIFRYHCYRCLLNSHSSHRVFAYSYRHIIDILSSDIGHCIYNKLSFKCLCWFIFLVCISYYFSFIIYFYLVWFHLSMISYYFSSIVYIVSYVVVIYSIDYVDIFDYYLFYIFIVWFHIAMLFFVYCNDYLLSLLFWELLGISSYLLLNFWSNKNHCGIMALIYNKLGDILFLYSIVVSYLISLSFDFESILLFIVYYYIYYPIILLSLVLALTTKLV